MKRIGAIIVFLMSSLFLSACGNLLMTATATPTVTHTPQPTATHTPTVVPTSTATPTVTPTPSLTYLEEYRVPSGGYRFWLPDDRDIWTGVDVAFEESMTMIRDLHLEMMTVVTSEELPYRVGLEKLMDEFISASPRSHCTIDPEPFEVDGNAARRMTVNSAYENEPVLSEMIFIDAGERRVIVIFAVLMGDSVDLRWEEEMGPWLAAFLDKFEIYDPDDPPATSSCPVSDDPTYGTTMDNPILIGGGSMHSPDRELAYLQNLVGPAGEWVDINRMRSFVYGDTMLIEYELIYTGLRDPVTIYINIGHWGILMAPEGFGCNAPFPLEPPDDYDVSF